VVEFLRGRGVEAEINPVSFGHLLFDPSLSFGRFPVLAAALLFYMLAAIPEALDTLLGYDRVHGYVMLLWI
jgi:hypothetical protein